MTRATAKQRQYIEFLTGMHFGQYVKQRLGKNPVQGVSAQQASKWITELHEEAEK